MDMEVINGDQIEIGKEVDLRQTEDGEATMDFQNSPIMKFERIEEITRKVKSNIDAGRYIECTEMFLKMTTEEMHRLLGHEPFLLLYLRYLLAKDQPTEVLQTLRNVEGGTDPELCKLWDEAVFRLETKKRRYPLTHLNKCRIRKRCPPPPGICARGCRPEFRMPKSKRDFLMRWYEKHALYPYPSPETKQRLAKQTGLSSKQVSTWFANIRRRTKLKAEGVKENSRISPSVMVEKVNDCLFASGTEFCSKDSKTPVEMDTHISTDSSNSLHLDAVTEMIVEDQDNGCEPKESVAVIPVRTGDTLIHNNTTYIVTEMEAAGSEDTGLQIMSCQETTTRPEHNPVSSSVCNIDVVPKPCDSQRHPFKTITNNSLLGKHQRKSAIHNMNQWSVKKNSTFVAAKLKSKLDRSQYTIPNNRRNDVVNVDLDRLDENGGQDNSRVADEQALNLAVTKGSYLYKEPLDLTYKAPNSSTEHDTLQGHTPGEGFMEKCHYRKDNLVNDASSINEMNQFTQDNETISLSKHDFLDFGVQQTRVHDETCPVKVCKCAQDFHFTGYDVECAQGNQVGYPYWSGASVAIKFNDDTTFERSYRAKNSDSASMATAERQPIFGVCQKTADLNNGHTFTEHTCDYDTRQTYRNTDLESQVFQYSTGAENEAACFRTVVGEAISGLLKLSSTKAT